MKKETKEYGNFGIFLDFLLSGGLIFGSAYVVFGLGRSPWWIVLAVVLCAGVGFPSKKTIEE